MLVLHLIVKVLAVCKLLWLMHCVDLWLAVCPPMVVTYGLWSIPLLSCIVVSFLDVLLNVVDCNSTVFCHVACLTTSVAAGCVSFSLARCLSWCLSFTWCIVVASFVLNCVLSSRGLVVRSLFLCCFSFLYLFLSFLCLCACSFLFLCWWLLCPSAQLLHCSILQHWVTRSAGAC